LTATEPHGWKSRPFRGSSSREGAGGQAGAPSIRSLHASVALAKTQLSEEGRMTRFHLFASALALGFALAAVGGAAARSQATTIRIAAANMTAANETPAPKGDVSGAHGTFTATLTKSAVGAEMSW